MPDILELTETEEDIFIDLENALDDVVGEPPTHRHFFTNDQLFENSSTGVDIIALCGYVKKGKVRFLDNLPVCPKCQWAFDNVVGSNLPPEDRDV